MAYTGKKPIDHTDVTQSQSMTVTDDLTVDTNTLKVDSTNNRVGVGTTSPSHIVHAKTTGSDYIFAESTSSSDNIGLRMKNGDRDWYVLNDASGVLQFYDGTDNATHMRLTNDPYLRLGGGGIQFNGDTAAANALDDYEEGTFTPVFDQSGTAISGVTTDINTGKYTKIGNKVTVQIYLHTTAAGSPTTNALTVGDLPFNAANVSNVHPSVSIGYVAGFVTASPTTGFLQPNTDYIRLFTTASGDARTNSATMIGSYLGSDTYLILNATYLTD